MFEMLFENQKGQQLSFGEDSPFTITAFEGLNPPTATINTNAAALMDGATFNSSKLNVRSMNIAFVIQRNAEENRLAVYKVIQAKKPLRIYYKSDLLDLYIDGYVESVNVGHWEKKQTVTVSILCPSPFFKAAQEVINGLWAVIPRFTFPFASTAEPELVFGEIDPQASAYVQNDGNVETGLIFELYARRAVSNPKIYNYITNEFIELNFEMQTGDFITIATGQGEKTVTLLRDATESNIFNCLNKNSTWLQLDVGESVFVYTIGEGNLTDLSINIRHSDLYEGV